MSFSTSKVCVIATTAFRKATTFQVDEVVDEVAIASYKLRGFLDWIAIGISLAELALIELFVHNPRMLENLWPRLDIIELATDWLLIDKVKIVPQLFLCHVSRKLG